MEHLQTLKELSNHLFRLEENVSRLKAFIPDLGGRISPLLTQVERVYNLCSDDRQVEMRTWIMKFITGMQDDEMTATKEELAKYEIHKIG